MFDFLEKYIMGPMTKLSSFPMIRAITFAGMTSIAFTIVGSMFLVLSVLPQAFPVLAPIWAVSFDKVTNIYMLAYYASMSAIALYFLLATAYEYTRILAEDKEIDIKPLNGALMALFAVLMLIPQLAMVDGVIGYASDVSKVAETGAGVVGGWSVAATGGPSRFAATGIFTAFIVAWFSVRIYAICVEKKIVIKLPDVVPDGVSRSFTALIPGFFIAFVCMLIQGGFFAIGTSLYDVIAIPFGFVVNIVGTFPGMLVIYFLIHALWLVGIHGATIVTSPLQAVTLTNLAMNAEIMAGKASGTAAVFAGEFNNAFVTIGGSGATLGLTILMVTMAKSDQLKYIGRAEIVPALFNINEPLLFGLPIVYNPALAVPFFLAPMAAMSIGYWTIQLGIIPPVVALMPWPTPVGLGAFISCGSSILAALVAVLCQVVATAIYFPFFKKYDSDLYKEEQEKLAAEKAEAAAA